MNIKKMKKFFSLNEPQKFDNNILDYTNDKKNKLSYDKKYNNENIYKILEQNENYIKYVFKDCYDLTIREISLFNKNNGKIAFIYLNEFTTEKLINDSIIEKFPLDFSYENNIEEYIKYTLGINRNNIYTNFGQCIDSIIDGNVVIFSDTLNKAFAVNIKEPPERPVQEPNIESTIRGPREGFTESISKNIILLRKKIKNTNLKTEKFVIGENIKCDIAICYMENFVDKKILNEVRNRISKIKIDAFAANYLVEAISDDKLSLVPTIFKTERPDVASSKILEGKILIITDNTPIVLSIPSLFVEFMQASDDYYTNYIPATLNRYFRYIGLIITLMLPGVYVSLLTFHQELIPTPFITTIMRSRSGIPLPSMWECFLMLSAYEIIREAGLRIPKTIGQTVSIVGTLILGEAAVRAGIVSEPMIIIVAFVGTAVYTIPSPELNSMILLIRYIILFLGGLLGIFGVLCGVLFLITYMTSRRSFGVPYMYPIMPFSLKRNQDVILRAPLDKLDKSMKLFKK